MCTTVGSDPNNCGACGSQCGTGESCCDGACVNLQADLEHCGGCNTVCAGPNNPECAAAACTAGTCGFTYAPAGKPVAAQTTGDCRQRQCDGTDNIVNAADDNDKPVDGNPCTQDACTDGTPSHPPVAAEQSRGPALVCDGQGACVGCVNAGNCPQPTNPECATATCTAGTCGFTYQPAGVSVSSQTAGDCHVRQCDGSGNIADNVDDSDQPVDGNACTDDVCSGGAPSNPPVPVETTHCPAPTNPECAMAACTAGSCGFEYQPAGTPIMMQAAGDCHTQQCDGSGNTSNNVDDNDRPIDSNPCTNNVCSGGVPSNPPVAAGTACGGGMVCDGSGRASGA